MERDTYQTNMAFIEETVQRLERGQVTIDELETLAPEFAKAQQFCMKRLTSIESIVQKTLKTSETPNHD